MPLFVPSTGTNRNDLYAGVASRYTLCNNIATTLTAAGWTCTLTSGWQIAQFAGQPSNGDTITVTGTTYTFNTVLGGANSILIGATLADTIANTVNAINGGPGIGTTYGIGTVTNPNSTASAVTATASLPFSGTGMKITAISTDPVTAMALAVNDTSANISWYYTNGLGNHPLTNWGYSCVSAKTPQGLRHRIIVYTVADESYVRHICLNASDTKASAYFAPDPVNPAASTYGAVLRYGVSVDWRIIANAHQCFIFANGVSGAALEYLWVASGTVYVPSFQAALSVTGATNASPIVITTSTAHNYTTGDAVCLRDIEGNTAANGVFTITVLSPTTYSLDASSGNGAYTTGGICGKISTSTGGQVAECIWNSFAAGGSSTALFRTNATNEGRQYWTLLNNSATLNNAGGTGQGSLQLILPVTASVTYGSVDRRWYNGEEFGSTAWVSMAGSIVGTPYVVGAIWSCVPVMQNQTVDDFGTMLGYNFWNLTDNNTGSGSTPRCSLYVIVP